MRKHLTQTEMDLLYEFFRQYSAIDSKTLCLELLAYTGMRQAELCELNGHAFDPVKNVIYVKSKKGSKRREIPLTDELGQKLVPLFKELLAREAWVGSVFSPHGSSLKNQTRGLRYFWVKVSKQIFGYYHVSVHGLRHSFMQRAFEATRGNVYLVQQLSGHKSLDNVVMYFQSEDPEKLKTILLQANQRFGRCASQGDK